ncbi:MAG: AAA family ATPase, partial [Phycisphaerales bacterium]
MITRLTLKNFRVFEDASVELEPFTLIVGPNASGKSTVLSALHWM